MRPVASVIGSNYRGETVVIGSVQEYTDPAILAATEKPFIALCYRTNRLEMYPLLLGGSATVDGAVALVEAEYRDYGLDVVSPRRLMSVEAVEEEEGLRDPETGEWIGD